MVLEEIKHLSLDLLKNHIPFWKSINLHNLLSGDLRKPPFTSRILKRHVVFEEIKLKSTQKPHSFWKSALKSQDLKMAIWESDLRKPPSWAEFSKGMFFFEEIRLILNLLKNHILFGNRLWKVRFENGDLRKWFEKTTFTSRILKRNVVFEEIKPKSYQKPHSFWKSALKSQDLKMVIWESDLRKPPSRAEFSKRTCFLRRLSLNLTFCLEIGSEKSDLKMVIWENHLHEQNSQKEPGFWGD